MHLVNIDFKLSAKYVFNCIALYKATRIAQEYTNYTMACISGACPTQRSLIYSQRDRLPAPRNSLIKQGIINNCLLRTHRKLFVQFIPFKNSQFRIESAATTD